MNARPDPETMAPAPAPDAAMLRAEGWPVHDALRLTQGGNQARIVLNGQVYALRITRAGKLILIK